MYVWRYLDRTRQLSYQENDKTRIDYKRNAWSQYSLTQQPFQRRFDKIQLNEFKWYELAGRIAINIT